MNIWDILILALVAAAVALAIRRMRRGKARCCERGCESCPQCCAGKTKSASDS